MKLTHLTKRERDNGSQYIAGTARYGIPTGSLVMLKRCCEHDDCYVLWTLEARKVRTDVEPTVFDGITMEDVERAARNCG